MPFYAYKDKLHTIEVKASAINTPAERSADYFCPGCTCKLRYRSGDSNKIAPHFYRPRNLQHDKGCWMPTAGKDSGDIDAYDWGEYSPKELLQIIQNAPTRSSPSPKTSGDGNGEIHKIKPTTVRQLFRICCENPDYIVFPDGSTVRDILCSRKTAYYYKNYCHGIKIIEAKYSYSSNKGKGNYIYFDYPYLTCKTLMPNFHVRIEVCDKKLYNEINRMLRGQTKPVLLFCNWRHYINQGSINMVCSDILNKHQIIPL